MERSLKRQTRARRLGQPQPFTERRRCGVSSGILQLLNRTSRTHRGRFCNARSGRFGGRGNLRLADDFDEQLLDDDAPRADSSAPLSRSQLVCRRRRAARQKGVSD